MQTVKICIDGYLELLFSEHKRNAYRIASRTHLQRPLFQACTEVLPISFSVAYIITILCRHRLEDSPESSRKGERPKSCSMCGNTSKEDDLKAENESL